MIAPYDLGLGTLSPAVTGMHDGLTQTVGAYSPRGGLGALRAALAAWCDCEPSDVIVTTGASMALTACFARLPPGTVLLPRPYFPAYPAILDVLGRRHACYPAEAGSNLAESVRRIAAGVERLSAVVINTPGNPTGAVWSTAEVAAVDEIAARRGAEVVIDETYRGLEFVDVGAPHGPGAQTTRIGSMSKLLGLPGARIGYAIAPPDVARSIEAVHWAMAMSPSTIGQTLALRALTTIDRERESIRARLRSARDTALAVVAAYPEIEVARPDGGIFLWLHTTSRTNSHELVDACAERGALVMDGAPFGQDRSSIRVSYAIEPDDIEPALHAVCEAIGSSGAV